MITPYCVKCRIGMRCEKNEVFVTDAPKFDKPFKRGDGKMVRAGRYGDLYKCPECGAEIVTGWCRSLLFVPVEEPERVLIRKAM